MQCIDIKKAIKNGLIEEDAIIRQVKDHFDTCTGCKASYLEFFLINEKLKTHREIDLPSGFDFRYKTKFNQKQKTYQKVKFIFPLLVFLSWPMALIYSLFIKQFYASSIPTDWITVEENSLWTLLVFVGFLVFRLSSDTLFAQLLSTFQRRNS